MLAHRAFAERVRGRRQSRAAARFDLDANPRAVFLLSAAWSPALGLWALVGNPDGVDAYILTSPGRGAPWTERANPKNVFLNQVIWTGAKFCAVGQFDGADSYVVTSDDVITWTERACPANQTYAVASEGGGKLLAVGQSFGGLSPLVKSDDHGVTWVATGGAQPADLRAVCWTGSAYVAVGLAAGGDALIYTSADRVTFTERANPRDVRLDGVTFGKGRVVAVGGPLAGLGAYVITSDDHGASWQGPHGNPAVHMSGVCFTGQRFVASDFPSRVFVSRNGETWAALGQAAPGQLIAPAFGSAELVVVGEGDGTKSTILRTRALL